MTSILSLELTHILGTEQVIISPVLIKTENDVILFDACLPNQVEQLEAELKKNGYSIQDLTHIIVSHQDHDHVGSLAALKKINNKVMVVASEIEEPYISGKKESLRVIQAEEFNKSLSGEQLKWGESFLNYLRTIEPCDVDKTIAAKSEKINGDITILHTPGHTPGHISVFVHSLGALIAGDTMAVEDSKLIIVYPQFTFDMDSCKQTIKDIWKLNPAYIYCYHGGMIENKDNKALDEIVSRLEGY